MSEHMAQHVCIPKQVFMSFMMCIYIYMWRAGLAGVFDGDALVFISLLWCIIPEISLLFPRMFTSTENPPACLMTSTSPVSFFLSPSYASHIFSSFIPSPLPLFLFLPVTPSCINALRLAALAPALAGSQFFAVPLLSFSFAARFCISITFSSVFAAAPQPPNFDTNKLLHQPVFTPTCFCTTSLLYN